MRIAGVNIPTEKKLYIGLTSIFGIGETTSRSICDATGLNPNQRIKELNSDDLSKLREYITANHRIEGELRTDISKNIKSKKDMKCYEGMRHIKRLPLNGQRTRTNARTRKGVRGSAIAKKKTA